VKRKGDRMFEPKKILVPTDFSEYSDKALAQAVDIATKYNSKIYLLHVIDQGVQQCVVDYCLEDEVVKQIEKEGFNTAQEKLKKELKKLSGMKGLNVEYDIKHGVPYDVILKEQREKGIDLIVMASHGKTGLMKYFMGSVAERVLRDAKSPVLLIRS
jgi:nucleotide-binding universal stress UspA family protein